MTYSNFLRRKAPTESRPNREDPEIEPNLIWIELTENAESGTCGKEYQKQPNKPSDLTLLLADSTLDEKLPCSQSLALPAPFRDRLPCHFSPIALACPLGTPTDPILFPIESRRPRLATL